MYWEQTGAHETALMDARSDLCFGRDVVRNPLRACSRLLPPTPLEWVHCHIARQPVAPADRRAVPEPLSAIVMKLLAKNAEERDQTAAGLEADFRRCLSGVAVAWPRSIHFLWARTTRRTDF